jgi:hypothetical protein
MASVENVFTAPDAESFAAVSNPLSAALPEKRWAPKRYRDLASEPLR